MLSRDAVAAHAARDAIAAHAARDMIAVQATPDAIAACAHRAMLLELFTHPKPGLVSHVDRGSHDDMDAATFLASAAAIRPFLAALAEAGRRLAPMRALRGLGIDAEAAMMRATGGINTHRGAIFGLGLLCAAAGARAAGLGGGGLGAIVAGLWGEAILDGPMPPDSHGTAAFRRFGAGGARLEAGCGFRTVYRTGLPALRQGHRMSGGDAEAARLHCLLALIASAEDTALLHRGGLDGLRFAQSRARGFLAGGSVGRPGWRRRAQALHRGFVARRLSAGGSADLLAMTLFVAMIDNHRGAALREAA